jgi:hypothetical protein
MISEALYVTNLKDIRTCVSVFKLGSWYREEFIYNIQQGMISVTNSPGQIGLKNGK